MGEKEYAAGRPIAYEVPYYCMSEYSYSHHYHTTNILAAFLSFGSVSGARLRPPLPPVPLPPFQPTFSSACSILSVVLVRSSRYCSYRCRSARHRPPSFTCLVFLFNHFGPSVTPFGRPYHTPSYDLGRLCY